MTQTLSLNPVVDIVVEISPQAAPRRTFNQGLIIGNSARIPAWTRLMLVDSGYAQEMIDVGFQVTDPEYLAAQEYFSQSPQPAFGWIGAQVPSALQTAIPHAGNAGTNYVAGDIVNVIQGTGMTITPANGTFDTFTISGANLTSAVYSTTGTQTGKLTISGLTVGNRYCLRLTPTLTSGQTPTITATSGATNTSIPTLVTATVEVIYFTASATSAVFTFTNTAAAAWSTASTTCYACSGQLEVLTIGALGAVATLGKIVGSQGQGYAAASSVVTVGGSGTGLLVDISTVGETALDAVTICRDASPAWYTVGVCGAAKADHIACAAYIEGLGTAGGLYMGTTQDTDVPPGTAGNVGLTIQADEYRRSWIEYSSATNDPYANSWAAAMGVAMGLNNGLPNSYFIMMFKRLVGILPETQLTLTQVKNIEDANLNVYVNRGSYYNMLEKGALGDGTWFDQVLFTDMLASNIQLNVMDLLYGSPAVPQTDPGVSEIIHAINTANKQGLAIGYISKNGVYNGTQPVLNLNPGDPMPDGYVCQAPSVTTLTPAEVSARQSPAIYNVINFTNGIQSVVIAVIVSNS